MRLSFDSIDEVREFVKSLKGTRGGKDKDDEGAAVGNLGTPQGLAPPPAQPPTSNPAPSFTPGAAPGGAFTPGAAPAAPPTMSAIVGRIIAQVDKLIAGQVPGQGAQPAEAVLQWMRNQVAPHDASAAGATMDQMKQVYLNKLPEAALNEMARQIAA